MDFDGRLALLRLALISGVLLLGVALFFFQVVRGDKYVRLASENRLRMLRIPPARGSIFDANGAPLALNVRTFDIKGYPLFLRRKGVYEQLERLFKRHGIILTEQDMADNVDRQYWAPYRAVTVAPNLTIAQVADLVTDTEFPTQLFPYPVWRRVYPAGSLVSHVVGYVGEITRDELQEKTEGEYLGGDVIGKMGIESVYESTLRGKAGQEAIEVDARGRRVRVMAYRPESAGRDVHLTLDLGAQKLAADLLGAYRGGIVALDVKTGAVKALYSSPSFDPNPLTWGLSPREWRGLITDPQRPMMNRVISGVYPPASTFKPFVALSGLAEGVFSASETVFCPGAFKLGNRIFRCWRKWGHGKEDVVEALRDSCDVYFYQMGLRIGIDRMLDWASRFGFGERTGIDLPGEAAGNVAGREWKKRRVGENWYPGDTVNYSIGQGYLLATPIQMARSYAPLATGGLLPTPHLVEGTAPAPVDLELPASALASIRKGLEAVVGTKGTGWRAREFGVSVAGKTGTAQNPHGPDHALFVGYAPQKEPRYVAAVMVEAGEHGSSTAAPMVGELLAYLVENDNEAEGGNR